MGVPAATLPWSAIRDGSAEITGDPPEEGVRPPLGGKISTPSGGLAELLPDGGVQSGVGRSGDAMLLSGLPGEVDPLALTLTISSVSGMSILGLGGIA